MLRYFLIFLLKFYKLVISPLLGKKCRFIPSCSEYFVEALRNYRLLKSFKLIFIRIAKCHPFSSNAVYDPINKIHK